MVDEERCDNCNKIFKKVDVILRPISKDGKMIKCCPVCWGVIRLMNYYELRGE